MPGVDGLEATRRIRKTSGPGTAIIAMTANAFDDDRDACLGAGMNDHLAKPVDPDRLYQVLQALLPARTRALEHAAPAGGELALERRLEGLTAIDVKRALWRVGGKPATLHRVLRAFAEHYRQGDLPLSRAVDASDREALRRAVHTLGGVCGNIGAAALESRAGEISDRIRRDDDMVVLCTLARTLNSELTQLAGAIAAALDVSARPSP